MSTSGSCVVASMLRLNFSKIAGPESPRLPLIQETYFGVSCRGSAFVNSTNLSCSDVGTHVTHRCSSRVEPYVANDVLQR